LKLHQKMGVQFNLKAKLLNNKTINKKEQFFLLKETHQKKDQ